jgi:hypothetical protein
MLNISPPFRLECVCEETAKLAAEILQKIVTACEDVHRLT